MQHGLPVLRTNHPSGGHVRLLRFEELSRLLLQLSPSVVAPIVAAAAITGLLTLLQEVPELSPLLRVHPELYGNGFYVTDILLGSHVIETTISFAVPIGPNPSTLRIDPNGPRSQ